PRILFDTPGGPGHVHHHFALGERGRSGSRNLGHRLLTGPPPHGAGNRHADGGNDEPPPAGPQSNSHRHPPSPRPILPASLVNTSAGRHRPPFTGTSRTCGGRCEGRGG